MTGPSYVGSVRSTPRSRHLGPFFRTRSWWGVVLLALGAALAWWMPWNFIPYGAKASPMVGVNPSHLAVVEQGVNAYWNSSWRDQGLTLTSLRVVQGSIYGLEGRYRVLAVSAKDGRVTWRRTLSQPISAPLIIAEGRILLLTKRGGYSTLLALSAASGKPLWHSRMEADSKVAYTQGQIWVVGGGKLVDRSPKTGRQVSSRSISGLTHPSSLLAVGHSLYISDSSHGQVAEYRLDLTTHRPVWRASLNPGSRVGVSTFSGSTLDLPVLAERAGTLGVVALSLKTGRMRWQLTLGVLPAPPSKSAGAGMLVSADGTLYLASALTHTIYAVASESGRLLWQNELGQEPLMTTPVVVANQVVVGDQTGVLWDIDQKSGQVEHRVKLTGSFFPEVPFLVGRTLYVSTSGSGGELAGVRFGRVVPSLAGGYQIGDRH